MTIQIQNHNQKIPPQEKHSIPLEKQNQVYQGRKEGQDPYLDIAQGMEKEFVKFLVAKMRENTGREEEDSSEMNYYNSLIDDEYADLYVKQNAGKNLQEVILRQIDPNRFQRLNHPQDIAMTTKAYKKTMEQD
jgi:Rod binding domain-containing protein